MSKLFEIPYISGGSLDVTPFIVLNSYGISSQPVYKKWSDGNGHDRRAVKRRRLEGSFSVKFFSPSDYHAFLAAIEGQRVEGTDYISVIAYDNKSRTVKTINAYIDYEPVNVEPSIGWSFNEEIEIKVTER